MIPVCTSEPSASRSDAIVFFHAHPDDEAIFTGGTLSRLAALGHRTVLVVATSGELGQRPGGDADLGARREAETREAAQILGVDRIEFLRYGDSGMRGDGRPGAFVSADTEEAATRLAPIVRSERACALVTYDSGGIYRHPDHLQVHRVGRRAAAITGVRTVYEATVDREYLHFVQPHLVELAGNGRARDRGLGTPSVAVSTTVAVRDHLGAKRAAIRAHGSQIPAGSPTMTMDRAAFAGVYGFEWYIRLGPPGPIDRLAS